jgi:hypothetical protein
VRVTSPLFTVAFTPGKSLVASLTPEDNESSLEICTGAVYVLVSALVVVLVDSFACLLLHAENPPADNKSANGKYISLFILLFFG